MSDNNPQQGMPSDPRPGGVPVTELSGSEPIADKVHAGVQERLRGQVQG